MIQGMDADPQSRSDAVDSGRPEPGGEVSSFGPSASPVSDERVALGHALQSRAVEVGRIVDERFSADLKGHAYVAARLATYLIGRWLATDDAASAEDEDVLAQQGERALMEDTVLATVAKAYFAWRDVTCTVLIEEAHRLAVSEELLDLASDVVRLSCDGSLVRIVRQFDQTRRKLQQPARRGAGDSGLPGPARPVDRSAQPFPAGRPSRPGGRGAGTQTERGHAPLS